MPVTVNKKSHFADVILRALLSLDSGQADAVTFTLSHAGEVSAITVGGVWVGEAYSWRVIEGIHNKITAAQGTEIYAGLGGELDATTAAMRLAWALAANSGEWALHG